MALPAFLDRYIARNVYDAQETGVPVSATREDNLMAPVAALHRTRGSFGSEASNAAFAVPGPAARLIALVTGALACLSIGVLAGRALPTRSKANGIIRSHSQR